jgi:predicted nucleic acid-binding protein
MTPVLDSNIVIDALAALPQTQTELERYHHCAISTVTWIEVMSLRHTPDAMAIIANYLRSNFVEYPLTKNIAEIAAEIRRERRLKLPDAVIWATAKANNTLLVTRNSKDFPTDEPDIRIPYTLA